MRPWAHHDIIHGRNKRHKPQNAAALHADDSRRVRSLGDATHLQSAVGIQYFQVTGELSQVSESVATGVLGNRRVRTGCVECIRTRHVG